ncbi:hypothetical protein D3C73_1649740 [compost metagenome]
MSKADFCVSIVASVVRIRSCASGGLGVAATAVALREMVVGKSLPLTRARTPAATLVATSR